MALVAEKLSIDAFLDWENAQPERHEFYRGEVFGMVGARRVHGRIGLNLALALSRRLESSRCQVFVETMKLQVANDAIFYPDVFVTCHPDDLRTQLVFRHPTLIAEVLSESTQAYDRSLKFAAYRRIHSLREYLLIDPDSRSVEVFRRNERGNFELIDFSGTVEVELASLGLHLPAAELFDGVDAPPA